MAEATAAGVLARNSVSNLARVASTSLVALLMPVVLVATLRPDLYALWALMFGLAGFVLYLDFGLPASVQTLVSRAVAGGDLAAASARAISGIRWASLIGVVMLAALAVAGFSAPELFPAVRAGGGEVALVVLAIGVGNIATFVGNTASAYFAGLQRSEIAAVTLVPGRVASLAIAVPTAVLTQQLVLVALAYAIPLTLGSAILVVGIFRGAPGGRRASLTRSERFLVLRFSGPLAAWSIYMLCISGAGIVIVGRFDFRAVAIFSLASAFAAALVGVQGAIVSPILSELGRAHEDRARFSEVTLLGTRINTAFVVLGVVGIEAVYLLAAPLLTGARGVPALEASAIVGCTVLAAGLRLTVSPLTYAFVAAGAHRRLLLPPLVEAMATLTATIALGSLLGGLGVALGLLIGATVGVSGTLFWSLVKTNVVDVRPAVLTRSAVLRPLLVLAPIQLFLVSLTLITPRGEWTTVGAVLAAVLLTALLAWCVCLPRLVRLQLAEHLRRRAAVAFAR
ncbi:hypothetical protein [uncultured Amnibacterium sp.]|uniref:hypothetical protein n=1 Tax=uncultured Amnibacterium sp. TaxID=1631851 RepID=UPI0035CC340E